MIDPSVIEDEDLKNTLSLVDEEILGNCDLHTPETLNTNHMLHVSTLKQDSIPPYISRRMGKTEDNTLPRVYVCRTLVQCLMGYAAFLKDTLMHRTEDDSGFKGGYHIYLLPFDYTLKPNDKLLFDASLIHEHWLIKYNEDTIEYKPDALAEMIVTSYLLKPHKDPNETTMVIQVILHNPSQYNIHLDDDLTIGHGYYSFQITTTNPNIEALPKKYTASSVTEIPEDIYMKRKNTHASLEHISINKPKYLSW